MNQELEQWLVGRPQIIHDLAASHPPSGEYKLANSDDEDVYYVHSYHEDGTLSMMRYSKLMGTSDSYLPMWKVFGMRPEDLVRVDGVDLPGD